ncbi:restriction endonuclease subunit S [Lactococcus lactis]|uniref:restriction endonuclease subunit S n=1 Tax=Lactococcus lactis TaxID=1358 RepID=UPI00289320F7|nr:restriction endonuclease subunit S [Lactococcus lactis]
MDNLHYEKFGDGTVKQVDIPFEIPESWEWVRFSEVSTIVRGGSPRPIREFITEADDGINWIKIGDTNIGGKFINSTKEKIKPTGLKKTRYVTKGTFLLTNSMSFGRPYILNVDGAIHDGWLAISNYEEVFSRDFLYYLLSSKVAYHQFLELISGAVVKNLNSDKVASLLVPVPPKKEQERIVSAVFIGLPKVEDYQKLHDRLEKINKEFPEKLRKSILQYAMQGKLVPQNPNDEPVEVLLEKIRQEKQKLYEEGKLKKKDLEESIIYKGDDNSYYEKSGKFINLLEVPFTIPNKWSWQTITNVSAVQMGQSPKGSYVYDCMVDNSVEFHQGKSNFGINVLEHSGKYTTHITKFISAPSIVMSVRAPVGDVNILSHDIVIGRGIAGITPYSPLYLKYEYLFLKTQKSVLEAHATGSTFKAISSQTLNDALIPIPPINEQIRIVSQVEKFYSCIVRLES